ncbi:hypothetical protein Y032_0002g723 [Ancylostoma ceylanicum]|nr:hypothetical protein Y032_0002g723 [Ancylostoma ceylanicum]
MYTYAHKSHGSSVLRGRSGYNLEPESGSLKAVLATRYACNVGKRVLAYPINKINGFTQEFGMRVLFLCLLFVACANAGLFDSKFSEKIKNLLGKIKNALDSKALLAIREKLHRLKDKIAAKLTLSPERKAELAEKLKNLIRRKRDHIQPKGDNVEEINHKVGMDKLLFQSDIVLTSEQADEYAEDIEADYENRPKRQAYRDRRYPLTLWANGVNYFFHPNASAKVKSVFKKGAQAWMKDTCIEFRETSTERDSIRVFMADGCWSFVGRLGGIQNLSLGDGCESVGTAAHEIGHALGFFHTQSRHDRDEYILLNTRSIEPDWLDQFAKQSVLMNDNYGITYDYGSIMHYGALSATVNGEPTMIPRDRTYIETLGSHIISFYELLMLNKHYGCMARCKEATSAKCKMGGFPHPRNCSKCICPSGYGGDFCDQRPEGCGAVLTATTTYKTLRDKLGNARAGQVAREDFMFCNYWIEALEGSRIEIKFVGFSGGVAIDGCTYAGVEIKTHPDQKMTGYRVCSPDDAGLTLISSSNRVPIITYNRIYETEAILEYRIVPGSQPRPTPYPQSTRPPRPSTSSSCRDSAQCSTLVKYKDFCNSESFTPATKKILCPVSCHLC